MIYKYADNATGFFLLVAAVFAPWALGTTQTWSVSVMNTLGYGMGVLLICKWLVRWKSSYQPPQWTRGLGHRWPERVLAALTVAILAYVLISALNAAARIGYPEVGSGVEIEYLEHIEWLPQSYDRELTVRALLKYCALALFFWASRDWLLGMNQSEWQVFRMDRPSMTVIPQRLSLLLWTCLVSAGALSIVGIIQRLDGEKKLLWLFNTRNAPVLTFGPFPYRGTAADYLNLNWPIGLAFWWVLKHRVSGVLSLSTRTGGSPHVVLVPVVAVIAVGALMTSSRGGFLVEVALVVICAGIIVSSGKLSWSANIRFMLCLTIVGMVGWQMGGSQLAQRLQTVGDDKLSGREYIYDNCARMASDFYPFGSGAETFPSLYYFYRTGSGQTWHAYAHDDFLETVITFGAVGLTLILVTLVVVPVVGLFGSGIPMGRTFRLLWITSVGGLIIHARFDMPFQVYSIQFTFLVVCAVLSCLTPARE